MMPLIFNIIDRWAPETALPLEIPELIIPSLLSIGLGHNPDEHTCTLPPKKGKHRTKME